VNAGQETAQALSIVMRLEQTEIVSLLQAALQVSQVIDMVPGTDDASHAWPVILWRHSPADSWIQASQEYDTAKEHASCTSKADLRSPVPAPSSLVRVLRSALDLFCYLFIH
jgi:hypothetical protein